MNVMFVLNHGNYLTENSRRSLKDAARRWDVDYVACDSKHYKNPRDKLRVFDIVNADRVLIIDADVLIRSDAPNPFDYKGDFIAVRSLHPSYNFPQIIVDNENRNVASDIKQIESKFGHIDCDFNNFINGGFIIIDKELRDILSEATRIADALPNTISYEQTILNYVLAKNKVVVTDIGFDWNARALKFPEGRMQHYVYHYAGQPERQKRIEAQNWYANYAMPQSVACPIVRCRGDLPEILKEHNYKIGAEIGVQKGLFSEYILQNWGGKLYSIDCWEHQPEGYITDVANLDNTKQLANFLYTKDRLARFGDRSQIIKAFSNQVGFAGPLDFAYIDANHSYKPFLDDLNYWYPRVREGGMISGHDFAQGMIAGTDFGVIKALEDFLADKKHILYTTDEKVPSECYPSWLFFKS